MTSPVRKTKEYTKPASEFGLTFTVVLGRKAPAIAMAREGLVK